MHRRPRAAREAAPRAGARWQGPDTGARARRRRSSPRLPAPRARAGASLVIVGRLVRLRPGCTCFAPNGMLLDLLEERFRALRFARSVRPAPLHGETLTAGDRSNICLGTIRTCWT